MGERTQVEIKDRDGSVFLYAHWLDLDELAARLGAALQRGTDRWNDAPYLARIVFCQMVAGNEYETTGFGISPVSLTGQCGTIQVDVERQTVRGGVKPRVSIDDFVARACGRGRKFRLFSLRVGKGI